jgi:hypothetical protein
MVRYSKARQGNVWQGMDTFEVLVRKGLGWHGRLMSGLAWTGGVRSGDVR